ncbi:MAG: DUF1249 domain-containing protein [Paraglaciecola sp.]|jgi:uncharacterized protein|nr:DUF1249 domain-containing protein [Paraglaciecola sp.]NCT46940.1 DUF1249 domain-containing protein [Paraglaciecola sp.]
MTKTRYVPKLADMHKVCEHNYARVLSLLPDCDTESLSYQFQVNKNLHYQLKIIDSSRYTSTIEMSQRSAGIDDTSPDYLKPVVVLRLYHDAQMAEVMSAQHVGALKPSYAYPNNKMYQRNEKEMVNQFLAEWLQFCLDHCKQLQSSGV